MRGINQAECLEIRHHIAHRGRRQRYRDQARNVARPDRFAGRQITLDDLTKYVPRALVELGQPGMRRDQANRFVVGHRLLLTADPNLSILEAGYKQALVPKHALIPEGRPRALLLRVPAPTSTPALPLVEFWRTPMRPSRRAPDELRAVSLERG